MPVNRPPNILLIFPDQHRWDALGCAGNPVVRSPNIDRLAAEGVLFNRAYTNAPLCIPARASFITGRYPHQHGTLRNQRRFPPPSGPNLIRNLTAAGYHCALIGKVHLGYPTRDTRENVEQLKAYGFTHVDEEFGKQAYSVCTSPWTDMLAAKGVLEDYKRDMLARSAKAAELLGLTQNDLAGLEPREAWYAGPTAVACEDFIDNSVGDRLVNWLDRYSGEQPFFLWAGFCGPHDPFDAPQEYADPYLAALEQIPLGSLKRFAFTPSELYNRTIEWISRYSDSDHLTPDRIRRMRAFYYANVTLIDDRIGHMLAALEKKDLLDNTWIIYTSDHGDILGDHLLINKTLMYEGSVHIPMIVRPPGGMESRRMDPLVDLNDVGATLLEIAGAAPVEGSRARSLLPLIIGPGQRLHEAVFSEVTAFSTVITDRYKYVIERESGVPCALYDLVEDPSEDNNLAGDPASEEIRRRLFEEHLKPFLAE